MNLILKSQSYMMTRISRDPCSPRNVSTRHNRRTEYKQDNSVRLYEKINLLVTLINQIQIRLHNWGVVTSMERP